VGDGHLATEILGSGPRLILVHGFTQTARCWGPVANDLARDHEVITIDAPGHGHSAPVRADIAQGAALIGDAGGPGTYLGYSMGGRFVLRLALDRPDLVRGAILVGASPGLDDPAARAARRAADEELAQQLEIGGVAAFLTRWLDQPLFAGLAPDQRHLGERLTNTGAGLTSSLRLAGTGAMEPLWDRLSTLSVPALLVAGERDEKFTAIAEHMATRIGPAASVAVIPGAGHTAHLEQPESFLDAVRTWLADRQPSR
jgi:2-succinyl-6-hydroxy-2,4-cyclohexadiene-1-carboxylate synthase